MSKKVRNILITSLLVVGVVVLSVGIYFIVKPSDKEIFVDAFKRNMSNFTSVDGDASSVFGKIFELKEDLNVKFSTDSTLEANGEYLTAEGDFYVNNSNQNAYFNFDLFNNDERLGLEAFLDESRFYHKIKDVYSRFYYIDLESLEDSSIDSDADFSLLFDYLQDVVISHITEENVTKTDKTITLDGVSFDTKKYTVSFSEKDIYEILRDYVVKIKNDKVLQDAFSTVFAESGLNLSFDGLITSLDEYVDLANDEKMVFRYSMYLDGNEVLSNEFSIPIESDEVELTLKLTINSYENSSGFENVEIYLSSLGIQMFSFEIKGVSSSESQISVDYMNMMTFTGTLQSTDTNLSFAMDGSINVSQEDGSVIKEKVFNMNFNVDEIVEYKEYDMNLVFDFSYEDQKMVMDSNCKFLLDEQMPEIDLSDSADISEMTDEEKEAYNNYFGITQSDDVV